MCPWEQIVCSHQNLVDTDLRDQGFQRLGREAAAGRRADVAGSAGRGSGAIDRSDGSKLRDELLNGEIFYTLEEAKVIIESWRRHYNTVRPHSSLGYRPPAPEVFIPAQPASQPGPPTPAALTLVPRPNLN